VPLKRLTQRNDKLSSTGSRRNRRGPLIRRKWAGTLVVVLFLTLLLQAMPLSSGSYHNWSGPNSTQLVASSSGPDFNLTVSPRFVYLYRGTSATSLVGVRSLAGFSGMVYLDVRTDAYDTDGISSAVNQNTVQIPSNGSANSTLTISATLSARFANYTVTVYASGGGLTHNQTVGVQFTWFTVYLPTHTPEIGLGSSKDFPVTIMSDSGFTGLVYLTGNSYSSGVGVSINPSALWLAADGTNETVVKLSVPDSFCPCDEGAYSVDLYATGRGVSNVFGLLVLTPTVWISLPTAIVLILGAITLLAVGAVLYKIRKKDHDFTGKT